MLNFTSLLESGTSSSGGSMLSIIMLVAIFAIMYFFMIRPQKKQEKKDAEMRANLEVGDEVTTIGGIIGKVVSIKEETFVLETTKDKTKIRFLKGAVRSVDVKAADLAAQVMEAKEVSKEDAAPAEEPALDAKEEPKKKSRKEKKSKENKD